ncbi:MAG: hypothetical protein A2136_09575, partial [Chloroflexi bacterium RBG_16_54_11]
VIGAVLGTFLTHFLTDIAATLWHFVIFASIGIVLSLILNFTIIRLSLQPLRELRQIVNHIQAGQAEVAQLSLEDTDPDIHQLSGAMNSLISQLQKSNAQLRLLSERAISVQEEERVRIARSLHDETGQSLSTLMIELDRLETLIPPDMDVLSGRLKSTRQLAADALASLRSIIYDLRPAILDDLGLLPAMRWYARKNLEAAGIQVQLDFPDDLPALPQPLSTTLFRVGQEGVNNIIRHSRAHNVSISLGLHENEVYLRLHDDGQGFTPEKYTDGSVDMQHWGLIGIQERIELVGGSLNITSSPEHGTTLQVSAPLTRSVVVSDG